MGWLWAPTRATRWRAGLWAVSGDSQGAPGLGPGVMNSGVRRASLMVLGDIQVMSLCAFPEQRMATHRRNGGCS